MRLRRFRLGMSGTPQVSNFGESRTVGRGEMPAIDGSGYDRSTPGPLDHPYRLR